MAHQVAIFSNDDTRKDLIPDTDPVPDNLAIQMMTSTTIQVIDPSPVKGTNLDGLKPGDPHLPLVIRVMKVTFPVIQEMDYVSQIFVTLLSIMLIM